MVGILVRPVAAADRPAVAEVYRRASLANEGDRESLLAHPETLEFPEPAPRARMLVAVADDRLVGFATVVPDGRVGELEDLFVDPDWMRRGIGTALVLHAVAEARELGLGRIEVTANPHALAFYERAGFEPDGTRRTRFGPGLRMHLDVSTG